MDDCIQKCLSEVARIIFQEKTQEFNFSVSRKTFAQQVEDLSTNLKQQVSGKASAFDFSSIACDESTDATNTAQLLLFLRVLDYNFCITKLLDRRSLKGTTIGKDIFEALSAAIDDLKLPWDKLCGVTKDGARAMTGEWNGKASMCAGR